MARKPEGGKAPVTDGGKLVGNEVSGSAIIEREGGKFRNNSLLCRNQRNHLTEILRGSAVKRRAIDSENSNRV